MPEQLELQNNFSWEEPLDVTWSKSPWEKEKSTKKIHFNPVFSSLNSCL